MSKIRPFRALRPLPGNADRVAAVPYDVVNTDEARSLAAGNPLSFLHVSRAEIGLPSSTHPYSDEVYERALRNFQQLRATAPLILEDEPSLYFYRLQMGNHRQTGLAACYSMEEYNRDLIRKHERTRPEKEDDRTRHIITLRAQTGPVFLTYRAVDSVDELAGRVTATAPLFDFEAADAIRHTVWRVAGADMDALVRAFGEIPWLYIADGHHRAASAARTWEYLSAKEQSVAKDEAGWFLAAAFPDNQTQILPYNRIVRDLAGLTPADLLAGLRTHARVTHGTPQPGNKGEVSMLLDGRWCTLHLPARVGATDIGSTLDVSLLQDTVLSPLLKIGARTRGSTLSAVSVEAVSWKSCRRKERRRSRFRCIPWGSTT